MPELRLQRTRAAYESQDPMNRLALIYLRHASGLIRDGRAAEAVGAIDEAVRILGEPSSRSKWRQPTRVYPKWLPKEHSIVWPGQ